MAISFHTRFWKLLCESQNLFALQQRSSNSLVEPRWKTTRGV